MAFTPPNLTAIEGARAVPPEMFSDTSSVDEHAPHSPSRISRKPIPPTSPSPDLSASERFVIILKWIVRILTLAFSILIGVYTVLLCNETVAGNKKNDAAQSAMISAQADANTLAALRACWTQNDLPGCDSILQHSSEISVFVTQMAQVVVPTEPSTMHTSTSSSPTSSAPIPSESSNFSSTAATNLTFTPVAINPSPKHFNQLAAIFLFCSYIIITACKAYGLSKRGSSVRLDEEMSIAPGAFNKSREEPSDTANVEESPDDL